MLPELAASNMYQVFIVPSRAISVCLHINRDLQTKDRAHAAAATTFNERKKKKVPPFIFLSRGADNNWQLVRKTRIDLESLRAIRPPTCGRILIRDCEMIIHSRDISGIATRDSVADPRRWRAHS